MRTLLKLGLTLLLSASLYAQIPVTPPSGGGGSGTVGNCSFGGLLAYYATSGTSITCNSAFGVTPTDFFISVLGTGNGQLPTYIQSVVGQQTNLGNNVFFNNTNWQYQATGGASSIRFINAALSAGTYQLSLCPIGTAGTTPAMDTTCVTQFSQNASGGNQTWLNSQATAPSFLSTDALVINPSRNWFVDFSGNQTSNNLTVNGTCTGCMLRGTLALTTATTDSATITGVTASSKCVFSPTNATAAAATTIAFVSSVSSNTVVIGHVATTANGGTLNIICTVN